jgi:hypothetical protein
MKRALAATAMAAFGLAPAIGTACEYGGDSSASAATPAQLVSAPAATKAPAPKVAKAFAPNTAKQPVTEVKAPVPEQKLAAATRN